MSISLDVTFFIQLVNFLISLVIINALIIKPIRSNMARRKSMIDSDMQSAEKLAQCMETQNKQYEDRISAVRAEIAKERDAYKNDAEALARSAINAANDEARAIRQESAQKVQNESKEALAGLQDKVASYSKEALAKILA